MEKIRDLLGSRKERVRSYVGPHPRILHSGASAVSTLSDELQRQ
jgi:hypothetical protein